MLCAYSLQPSYTIEEMCNPLSPLGEGMILHLKKGFSQAKDAYGDKLGENRPSDSEEQDF